MRNLWLRFTAAIEHFIVTRLVPERVGPVMRLVFKLPILLYDLGLGALLGGRILILTTRGRKTGRLRRTALEYGYNLANGSYFLMSGWSGRADWYRNALACPEVHLRIGRQQLAGIARRADPKEVLAEMHKVLRISPRAVNTWSQYSHVVYDGTDDSLLKMAQAFPSLIVQP